MSSTSAEAPDTSANLAREPAAPKPVPLRARLLKASAWVVVGAMGGHVLRLVSNLIVARMVAPELFGIMAIAGVVPLILALITDAGLHQNIIRSPRGQDPVFLNTAWTVQVIRGFLIWAMAIPVAAALYWLAHAGVLAADSAYAAPELPWVVAALTFTAVLMGFQSTKLSTATRELDQRQLVMLELFVQLVSLVLMVAAVWWTRSIWAFVFSTLASQLLYTVLSQYWLTGAKNHFAWDKPSLHELLTFGKWIFISSMVGVFAMNGDRLLLAAYDSAHYLGLYSIAFALVGALDMLIGKVFSSIFLPAFSEVARKGMGEVAGAYERLRKKIDPIVLLAAGMLFVLGPRVVDVLYDERYAEAGRILSILSVGMVLSRYSLVQQVYLAINEPRYHAVLNTVRAIATYTVIPLGYFLGGTEGAVWGIALRNLPTVPFIFWFNARHGLNHPRLETLLLLWWGVGWALGTAADATIGWVWR